MKRVGTAVALVLLCTAASAAADQRFDFILHCAGCHKLDGSGSEVVPALDETGAIFALPGGRQYLGSVPGVAQAPLDDRRLADLLNWVLQELGGTKPQPPYSREEISRLRAKPLRDPLEARARLVARDPPATGRH
jgi:mono/diheme cytochrome c family protein